MWQLGNRVLRPVVKIYVRLLCSLIEEIEKAGPSKDGQRYSCHYLRLVKSLNCITYKYKKGYTSSFAMVLWKRSAFKEITPCDLFHSCHLLTPVIITDTARSWILNDKAYHIGSRKLFFELLEIRNRSRHFPNSFVIYRIQASETFGSKKRRVES